ncbi:hypothetical protein IE53DRAFT_370737 [Violaceomyces palustris]|uniref:Uncharacterized protein n=1 Tax=Violaceomyces palustris TaxID=1673888 RepID=A0ACD0NR37_9BASI|nr:hypothetical protein IE53DRAFT_370737 [Violaceomyces palustris]
MAGVMDYMRSNEVQEQFLATHRCIRRKWGDFIIKYAQTEGSAPNVKNVNIEAEINRYTYEALDGVGAWVKSQLENMIEWYEPDYSKLSYNAVIGTDQWPGKDLAPLSTPVNYTKEQLTASILDRLQDDIPWKSLVYSY